ncbi:hypothetical protein CPB85DRAFT_1252298 [Mucidula mucida]|nr:hypothetical protein CPB85DRAFT_1252298 [Mucidula mucida]
MFASSSMLVLALGMVSAGPVASRSGTCKPAFDSSKGMFILNGQREWARGGRVPPPYHEPGLARHVATLTTSFRRVHTSSSLLDFVTRAGSQMWTVECSTCDSPNYSTGHYAGLFSVFRLGPSLVTMYIGNGFDQLFDFWVHADQ